MFCSSGTGSFQRKAKNRRVLHECGLRFGRKPRVARRVFIPGLGVAVSGDGNVASFVSSSVMVMMLLFYGKDYSDGNFYQRLY